jgi:hypothetical protein
VNITEELLKKNGGSGLENRDTTIGDRHADYAPRLYPQKLALISRTSGGRSVGIVRLGAQAVGSNNIGMLFLSCNPIILLPRYSFQVTTCLNLFPSNQCIMGVMVNMFC